MRILLGNPEAGEIAYQPLLLEQEHAIELARTRAMAARSEQLGTEMVGHVATLQQASDQMRAETAELAHRLEVQTAYIKMLEAKLAAMGADPVPAPASPKPPSPQPSPSSSSKPAVPTVTKS
jgi:multidrug resistance efflux pump